MKSSASSQLTRRQVFVQRSSRIWGYSSRRGLSEDLACGAAAHAKETLTVRVALITADGLHLAVIHLKQHSAECWMAIHGTHGPHDFRSGHGQKRGRPKPVPTIMKGAKPTFLHRHMHSARERRGIGWFTLCNIPCGRAIFAEYPEGRISLCHQRHQDVLINRSKS
jgi:hypothetical protein